MNITPVPTTDVAGELSVVLACYDTLLLAADNPDMGTALREQWAGLVGRLGVERVDALAPWLEEPYRYVRTAADPFWAHWRCPICGGTTPDPWTYSELRPTGEGLLKVVGVPRCIDRGHDGVVMEWVLGPRDWLAELRIRLTVLSNGWVPEALEHDSDNVGDYGPTVYWPWRIPGVANFAEEESDLDLWPTARLIAHAHADLTRAAAEVKMLRAAVAAADVVVNTGSADPELPAKIVAYLAARQRVPGQ